VTSPDPSLAAERTSLAWQRTGMTTIATGMAMLRLLPPSTGRPVLAVAMVLAGALVTVGARRMHPSVPHRRSAAALAATVAAFAVAGAVLTLI
jgi:uncharacterized membrane protein YidH (DUF202 family)